MSKKPGHNTSRANTDFNVIFRRCLWHPTVKLERVLAVGTVWLGVRVLRRGCAKQGGELLVRGQDTDTAALLTGLCTNTASREGNW